MHASFCFHQPVTPTIDVKDRLSDIQELTQRQTVVCYCGKRNVPGPGSRAPAASPETPAWRRLWGHGDKHGHMVSTEGHRCQLAPVTLYSQSTHRFSSDMWSLASRSLSSVDTRLFCRYKQCKNIELRGWTCFSAHQITKMSCISSSKWSITFIPSWSFIRESYSLSSCGHRTETSIIISAVKWITDSSTELFLTHSVTLSHLQQ